MKKIYERIENLFGKLTFVITVILGNSLTFILALAMVLFWWIDSGLIKQNMHQRIGDIIFGTTFLSLFVIQKSFNRFSALMHLKINELVSSHETANNAVIHAGTKTEREITQLGIDNIGLIEKELEGKNVS